MGLLDRIIRTSPAMQTLLAGQRKTYIEYKEKHQSDIDYVSAQPAGYVVHTESGLIVPKDDWLNDAATEMAELDAHIAELDQYIT